MRSLFLFSFLFLSILNIKATHIEVSGDVSGHWNTDTVIVVDHIRIPAEHSLSIDPGVKVIFQGYFYFTVNGNILALGQQNDSISFIVSDTLGFHQIENNKGAWAGFWFTPSSSIVDSSLFEYCSLKYAKAISTDSIYWYGGAVFNQKYSQLRFSNSSFTNNKAYKNGGAIYCRNASIKINNCIFKDNQCGTAEDYGYGGAVCLEYSNSIVLQNEFIRNSSTGVGGGLSFEYSNPEINANVFYDNYSAIGGGLCGLRSEKGNNITNNLIEKNESLFFGGGVAFLEAHSLFCNNTIVDNFSMYGGGIYFNAEVRTILKNNIVWNNSSAGPRGLQIWIYDVYSAPEFYYNNIEGGFEGIDGEGSQSFIGVYENNLDADPLFSYSEENAYSLLQGSPCINAGTPDTLGLNFPQLDLAGNARIIEERIDLGCYEFQESSGLETSKVLENDFWVSPNPIKSSASFHINVAKFSSKARLMIYNARGMVVESFEIKNASVIHWDAKDDKGNPLPSGIYFYSILDENDYDAKKLILYR
jgi:predicted outer membrane repeat protein